MLHLSKTKTNVSAHAAANQTGNKGKALAAVPVFQKKADQLRAAGDDSMQLQGIDNGAVVQTRPTDWVRSAKIAEVLTHQPGYFSTWKKIVAAINEYKLLRDVQYVLRTQKLDLMDTLIAEWKEGHKNDTTARVVGIRGILPDLEGLIQEERYEINFANRVKAQDTAGEKYQSATREDMSFSIVKQGEKLVIVSDDERISGNLEYDIVGSAIELKHFEAQPEGLGLGTVLMHEFADLAVALGIPVVRVQLPAMSAMGAYEVFGGVPLADKQEDFNQRKTLYAEQMGLAQNAEHGEHITADHGDMTYDNFISEEAKAIGNTRKNKAQFDRPDAAAEELEQVRVTAEQAHIAANVRNVANVKRVARLKALSNFLSYNIPALFNKTNQMMAGKWIVVDSNG